MIRSLVGTAVLALAVVGATDAQTIVDVSAVTNDIAHPVTLRLTPGMWRATPIDVAQGGAYTSWHPWGGTNVGCGATPGTCAQGWMWSYFLEYPGMTPVQVRKVVPGIGVPKYATEGEGFTGGAVPFWLPVGQTMDITVWIGDSNHQDNLGGVSIRFEQVTPERPTFTADVPSISMRTGGAQRFTVDGGAMRAGHVYFVLGSSSGTAPGLSLTHWLLPLNGPDAYLDYTVNAPNTTYHVATFGTLDASGRASPRLELAGPQPPGFAGLVLHHAVILLDGAAISGISLPVRVDLLR